MRTGRTIHLANGCTIEAGQDFIRIIHPVMQTDDEGNTYRAGLDDITLNLKEGELAGLSGLLEDVYYAEVAPKLTDKEVAAIAAMPIEERFQDLPCVKKDCHDCEKTPETDIGPQALVVEEKPINQIVGRLVANLGDVRQVGLQRRPNGDGFDLLDVSDASFDVPLRIVFNEADFCALTGETSPVYAAFGAKNTVNPLNLSKGAESGYVVDFTTPGTLTPVVIRRYGGE